MRKPLTRSCGIGALVLLAYVPMAVAQQHTLNRVADGAFESGLVSLRLPKVPRFPVFSGGWAARGAGTAAVVDGGSFDGSRSLRIDTRPGSSVQVLQDLPLTGSAYALYVMFFIERGNQTVRLLNEWRRGDPGDGTPAFEARLSASGAVFSTPAGTWRLDVAIAPFQWHSLGLVADPRTGAQLVRIDGRSLLSIPGASSLRRSTLILGGGAADRGTFRFDAVEATSLVDLELATLESAVAAVDMPGRAAVLGRFDAARAALARRSPTLAAAELRVARALLGDSGPAAGSLRAAVTELMELIRADGGADGG